MEKPFKYIRTTRMQALHVAFVSIVFVVICKFAIELLGNIKGDELKICYIVISVLFVGLWGFFVVPNILNNSKLECVIDDKVLKLHLPDGTETILPLNDIEILKKTIKSSMDNYVEYWVVTKESSDNLLIPAAFGLSPHQVFKEIKARKPDLEIKKGIEY